MTDLERDVAAGRAYGDLKRSRSNAAMLSSSLDAYARDLQAASKMVSQFAASPRIDVRLPWPEGIRRDLCRLPDPVKMADLIDELVDATRLADQLQSLIDQF